MNQLIAVTGHSAITMGTREIAEMLGRQHSNIKISAERLASTGVIGGGLALQEREFKTERGNTYTEYLLCKRDSLVLVAQNSPEFTARIIDRWQELESGLAPKPNISPITSAAEFAEIAGRALNMSNSSKLGMFRKIQDQYGLPDILPAYSIDAPAGAADGSSRPTKALTTLLRDAGVKVSPKVAFLVLADAGIVERRERPSKGSTTKQFWSITSRGLVYGKNMTSPNNPRETQPHFFDSTAPDIIRMISAANDNQLPI